MTDTRPAFDESGIPDEDKAAATEDNADYEVELGGENAGD